MKNILAIIGSPRNQGNTYYAVKKICEEILCYSNVNIDFLFLNEINLKPCKGCLLCLTKGEDKCPIEDDKYKIDEMIKNADLVIFATPVYGLNVSGIFKNFLDRYSYHAHRPGFLNKKAAFIVTAAGLGIKETLKVMNFIEVWGFKVIYKTGIITPPLQLTEKCIKKNNSILTKAAEKIHRQLIKKQKNKARLTNYLNFIVFKSLLTKSPESYRNNFTADYEFYQKNNYLDKKTKFFFPAKINPFYKLIGWFLKKAIIKKTKNDYT